MRQASPYLPHSARPALRIPRQRRLGLYGTFAFLLATGALWLLLRFATDEPESWGTALAWSMKIHGAAAMVSLFLVGTIWNSHIRHAWKKQRNRVAGALFGGGLCLLVISGYGLYYFNGELLRACTDWLHWAVGLALGPVFWIHLRAGRARLKGD